MVPRLKDLCLSRMAINIANGPHVKQYLHLRHFLFSDVGYKKTFRENVETYYTLEYNIHNIVKEYQIPCWIKEKIHIDIIILCQTQMMDWAKFHEEKFDVPIEYGWDFIRSSFFTSEGLLNKEIAARELVKDTQISSCVKFCLACYYCFSDVIPALWEELEENEKPRMNEGVLEHGFGKCGDSKMVILWSKFMLGKFQNILQENDSFSLHKFKIAVKDGNEVSVEHCWKELNEIEKDKALRFFRITLQNSFWEVTRNTRNTFWLLLHLPLKQFIGVIKFLVPRLDNNQLRLLFENEQKLNSVLFHFLSESYVHLFMDMVERTWEILSEKGFYFLLLKITNLMLSSFKCKACHYHQIFTNLWKKLPSSFKRFFFKVDSPDNTSEYWDDYGFIYSNLYENGLDYDLQREFKKECFYIIGNLLNTPFRNCDKDVLHLVLEDATTKEKFLIAERYVKLLWEKTKKDKNFKLVVVLIEYCVPKERVVDFKMNFFSSSEVYKESFWEHILRGELNKVQNFIQWAFIDSEINNVKKNLLSQVDKTLLWPFCINRINYIDEALKWLLSSDDIENYKKLLVLTVEDVTSRNYSFLLIDFVTIDLYLKWVFSSEKQIKEYKRTLANFILDVYKDVEKADRAISWNNGSYNSKYLFLGMLDCCELFFRQEFQCIDAFFKFCEFSEGEVKDFKEHLIFSKSSIAVCISMIIYDKEERVSKLLEWSHFSEAEVKKFYSSLPGELKLDKYLTHSLGRLDKFFKLSHLSEEEVKGYKRDFGFKNPEFIKERLKNRYFRVEELLNWLFSSKEDKLAFMTKFPLHLSEFMTLFRFSIEFENIEVADTLLTWTKMDGDESKTRNINKMLLESQICKIFLRDFLRNGDKIIKILDCLFKHKIPLNAFIKKILKLSSKTVITGECLLCGHNSKVSNMYSSFNGHRFCGFPILTVDHHKKLLSMLNEHINNLNGQ